MVSGINCFIVDGGEMSEIDKDEDWGGEGVKKLTWKQIKKNCEEGIPIYMEQIPKKYLGGERSIRGVIKFYPPLDLNKESK